MRSSSPVNPRARCHYRLDGYAIDEHNGARAATLAFASTTCDNGGITVATKVSPIRGLHASSTLP
jgi:hypothetical protein